MAPKLKPPLVPAADEPLPKLKPLPVEAGVPEPKLKPEEKDEEEAG